MPGVSTMTSWASGLVTMPRTARRVVCGLSEVMAILLPTSALSSVDFPALGRPTKQAKPDRCAAAPVARRGLPVGLHSRAVPRRRRRRRRRTAPASPDRAAPPRRHRRRPAPPVPTTTAASRPVAPEDAAIATAACTAVSVNDGSDDVGRGVGPAVVVAHRRALRPRRPGPSRPRARSPALRPRRQLDAQLIGAPAWSAAGHRSTFCFFSVRSRASVSVRLGRARDRRCRSVRPRIVRPGRRPARAAPARSAGAPAASAPGHGRAGPRPASPVSSRPLTVGARRRAAQPGPSSWASRPPTVSTSSAGSSTSKTSPRSSTGSFADTRTDAVVEMLDRIRLLAGRTRR